MKKLLLILLLATPLHAQTVVGDRVRLAAGPCFVSSQSGPPIKLVLEGNCTHIATGAPGTNLTLSPTGDLITDPAGNDILPELNYDINIGMLSKKYLSLHAAELWVETLVAQNTIATIGGRVLVAPTNILTSDLTTGATSISVKYNNFVNGDRVYMEANGSVEFMAVTSSASGSGPYTYFVTRNLDGSGANAWFAGDALLNTGITGSGFIDLYSVRGVKTASEAGPSIVGNVRLSSTYNDWAPRWAIGNLNGLYGYGATTYGTAFGDPLTTNVTIDATNGFRIRSGTTNKFYADTVGNLALEGNLSIGTNGVLRSNKTACNTGTGFWLAYNGGTPEFCIGDPAGSSMTWNGSSLVIRGSGGSAKNLVRNSECRVGTSDWTGSAGDTGLALTLGTFVTGLNSWAGTCYIQSIGTPGNATSASAVYGLGDGQNGRFPVVAGKRYEASVYLGMSGTGAGRVTLEWFNNVGASISTNTSANTCTSASTGIEFLQDYCRSGVVALAPAGATSVAWRIARGYSGGSVNPYTAFVRMFFGEATTTQTELSEWGPAGMTEITGGMIRTDAIDARTIAANTITANEIAANTITAGQIAAGTITATQIAAGTITATQIATSTITATQIAANTITAAKIAAGTITATEIAAGTITFAKLVGTDITALGSVTAGTFSLGSGNFAVNGSGYLTAVDAVISGLTVNGGGAFNGGTPALVTFNTPIRLGYLDTGSSSNVCIDSGELLYRC